MIIKSATGRVPKRRYNRWFRRLQEFADSSEEAIEVIVSPDEYSNIRSTQSVACSAIKRNGFSMKTTVHEGSLYIYKVSPGGENDD